MTEVLWTFDHILILQDYKDPGIHKHLAKHMIFSLNSEFECIIGNKKICCRGICIDSNIYHTVDSSYGSLLVYIFDETSFLSEELDRKYLKGRPFCILDEKLVAKAILKWNDSCNEYNKLDDAILSVYGLYKNSHKRYGERVNKLLDIIKEKEGIYEDTIDILCKKVCLSKSRISHLFKEQVGVSLSSYLVFEKMRKTYLYVLNGENITNACVHAGFYSSSHFSAVCRRMFGFY